MTSGTAPAGQLDLFQLAIQQQVENTGFDNEFDAAVAEVTRVSRIIENVAAHTDETWKNAAKRKLKDLCQSQESVTVDDLFYAMKTTMLPEPKNPKVYGYIMKHGYREKWIAKTGRVATCSRPSRNRGDIAIWQSLIYSSTDHD